MNAILSSRVRRYRAVFLSDTHLGTRGCRADFLADFLRALSCDRLYLVGDIIDGWRLRRSWYWDAGHDEVLRLILSQARSGTEIVYIPGNHDEMFRNWLPLELEIAGVKLRRDATHVTASGMRLLVIHGDEFDSVVRYAKFLALLGDGAYTAALVVNRWFSLVPTSER
jgi:UDP-2,3-diacylglucosamine pyrophosphatase LpxH